METAIDPVSAIAEKMKKYPQVSFEHSKNRCIIGVPNNGGFKIELLADNVGCVVYLGESGMHEHFSDPTAALEFVAFSLSDSCRLREKKMPFFQQAFLEYKNGEHWDIVLEFGSIRSPFPIRYRESIFQNTLIK